MYLKTDKKEYKIAEISSEYGGQKQRWIVI